MSDEKQEKPAWLGPTWYHTLIGLAGALALIFAAKELWSPLLISCGFCLIGIGEWQNHKVSFEPIPGLRVAKAPANVRSTNWLGLSFDAAGIICIVIGSFIALRT